MKQLIVGPPPLRHRCRIVLFAFNGFRGHGLQQGSTLRLGAGFCELRFAGWRIFARGTYDVSDGRR